MTTEESVWRDIESCADELLKGVRALAPDGELELALTDVYIAGMFWRSVRLFDGTLLLLKAALPEEAAFLARSMFEEALRLQQLAAEPQHRNSLVLAWAERSIAQKRGLLEVARALGSDQNIDAQVESLEAERRRLNAYAKELGVHRFRHFRSVKDAAVRFDRREDYWTTNGRTSVSTVLTQRGSLRVA